MHYQREPSESAIMLRYTWTNTPKEISGFFFSPSHTAAAPGNPARSVWIFPAIYCDVARFEKIRSWLLLPRVDRDGLYIQHIPEANGAHDPTYGFNIQRCAIQSRQLFVWFCMQYEFGYAICIKGAAFNVWSALQNVQ